MMRRASFLILGLTLLTSPAVAQGNLSTHGLGFPPGQLSTAARTMGGSIGESDALSPLNPAAIGLLSAAIVMMQAEPEYRHVKVGSRSLRSSVARFPLFQGALPIGGKWTVGISSSTLLDRTWETTTRDSQFLQNGPEIDTVAATLRERSNGSIEDMRFAVAYAPATWMRVGIGLHAFTGRDVLESRREFDDSVTFATDTQTVTLGFGGNAISVGLQTIWENKAAFGIAYRKGGDLTAEASDVTVGSGSAPDHFGASLVYLGIAGTTLGVRAAKDTWSRLRGVAQTLNVHEGWDFGVGADVNGPRFGPSPVALRAGARWRTLPFSPGVNAVKERTWSGGVGLPMARGRAELNLGLLYSSRSVVGDVSETSWTLSTGFAIRP